MRHGTLIILALLAAGPAWGQAKPSFDCAKASTDVERAICKSADLSGADRTLAASYAGLLGKLAGPARDHLQKDQLRWIADRDRACSGGVLETEACLRNRYEARGAVLAAFGIEPYPFVSEHAILKRGKVKATRFLIDASYPQFDGLAANFTATNRHFLESAQTGMADAVPDADVRPDADMTYSYDQRYMLHRPTPNTVSVELTYYSFTGGAHGFGATLGSLVDLSSGRIVGPADVFTAGDDWRRKLRDITVADLKKQFEERPGFDDSLEPANMDKLLSEPQRYVWRAGRLEIVFNQYDVGPYAAGPYTVKVPYARLKPLLSSDGPLDSLR